MSATPGITVVAPAATAVASAPSATVSAKAGTLAAGAVASAPAPRVIVAGVVLAYAVVTHGGYHLAADHHDLIAYGSELALVLALIFVGGRIVAGRRFRSE